MCLRGRRHFAPGRIDSDRLWPIFAPAGRRRRLNRCAIHRTGRPNLSPDAPNKKGPLNEGPFFVWRARKDSNLRPPGS